MYISKEEYDDDRTEIEEDPEEDDLSEGFILSNNPDDEVVLDLTGEYEGVVRKVRAIVKFFKYDKRNCVLQDKLNQVQAENRLAIREMRLQLDCPTRWNTILAMLRSVLKEPMQTVLAELCELFEPVLVGLTEEEWILAKSLFEGLLPLEVLTKKLSEAHCSLLEAEYLFLSTIDIMRSLKTRFAEKLTAILITRYQQRRNVELISVLSFLANPLDYDQGTPEFPKLEMYELRNKVEQLNDRLFPTSESTSESTSEHVPVASDAAPATSSNTTEDFAISVALKLAKRMKLWKEKSVNTDNKKIIQEELRLASVTGELPDNLKKLETALLSIPASSVDCERAFSTAGRFCTKIRNRLSARSLDNFCFARAYLRKIDSQESQEFQI